MQQTPKQYQGEQNQNHEELSQARFFAAITRSHGMTGAARV
jgi:hypothetical protein